MFATSTCSCKSKSQVVTNFALRPAALSHIEQSGYGIHAIAPCAPSLGLALTGRVMFNEEGAWRDTPELATLYDIKPAPFQKFSQRLQLFRAPTLSIVARCTCFNTYIVSVMPYTASYFGLSTSDLNLLRQQAVKFLLKRHWLESEILPYILRYVGIAPVLDPALVATVAATGLYFREGNTLEDLVNMDLLIQVLWSLATLTLELKLQSTLGPSLSLINPPLSNLMTNSFKSLSPLMTRAVTGDSRSVVIPWEGAKNSFSASDQNPPVPPSAQSLLHPRLLMSLPPL